MSFLYFAAHSSKSVSGGSSNNWKLGSLLNTVTSWWSKHIWKNLGRNSNSHRCMKLDFMFMSNSKVLEKLRNCIIGNAWTHLPAFLGWKQCWIEKHWFCLGHYLKRILLIVLSPHGPNFCFCKLLIENSPFCKLALSLNTFVLNSGTFILLILSVPDAPRSANDIGWLYSMSLLGESPMIQQALFAFHFLGKGGFHWLVYSILGHGVDLNWSWAIFITIKLNFKASLLKYNPCPKYEFNLVGARPFVIQIS